MLVGTKELKNRLSHYLRAVRAGEKVMVMDRFKVVAELRRAPRPSNARAVALLRLGREGAVTLSTGRPSPVAPLRPVRRISLAAMILEDRR